MFEKRKRNTGFYVWSKHRIEGKRGTDVERVNRR